MTTPAVRDLNMALTRISSDLQFVSHRLEAHLREISREGSRDSHLPDLAKLSKRITALETNIPLLEKHAENLTKRKAVVLEKLSTVSLENHDKMVAVYERLGFGAGGVIVLERCTCICTAPHLCCLQNPNPTAGRL